MSCFNCITFNTLRLEPIGPWNTVTQQKIQKITIKQTFGFPNMSIGEKSHPTVLNHIEQNNTVNIFSTLCKPWPRVWLKWQMWGYDPRQIGLQLIICWYSKRANVTRHQKGNINTVKCQFKKFKIYKKILSHFFDGYTITQRPQLFVTIISN